jgi:chromosome segregation ATPase
MAVITVLGGGGGIVALVTVGATRRKLIAQSDETVAGAVKVLMGGATDLVEPLRKALDSAEGRADKVNSQLREARTELDGLRLQVEAMAGQLRRLQRAILAPDATLEHLRSLIVDPTNGRP